MRYKSDTRIAGENHTKVTVHAPSVSSSQTRASGDCNVGKLTCTSEVWGGEKYCEKMTVSYAVLLVYLYGIRYIFFEVLQYTLPYAVTFLKHRRRIYVHCQ